MPKPFEPYSPRPDPAELISQMKAVFGSVPLIFLGMFLLSGFWSSFYTVPAEAEAVVTRFGRYNRTVPSGLRVKLPWGLETVQKLPVKRQLKAEFGFATPGGNNPHQNSDESEQVQEKQMVTGDLNVALVEWVVQYRIQDSRAFLFNVKDPEATLRDVSEAVMRRVVGDRGVDEVITVGRQDIEFQALKEMQILVNKYELGLTIDQVQLKDVNPPEAVQNSFNEVNQAQQERERSINIANGQFNKAIPQARGMADQQLREAEGYATKRINEAEGDAARFNSLYAEYTKAPEITRKRIYLETLQEVLPRLGKRVVVDESLRPFFPLLPLTDGAAQPPPGSPAPRNPNPISR